MKLVPWRERAMVPALRSDLESWMDEFFNGGSRLPEVFRRTAMPAVDLSENEKEFTAAFELPGLEEKDISVQILGDQLLITAERKWKDEKKEKEFFRVESQYGTFRRTIALPDGLRTDSDSIKATYEKGILEIKIPKLEPRPATKVQVRAK